MDKEFFEDLEFPVYKGPALEPITQIHRETDGVIYFVKNGAFKEEFAVRRRYLDMMFPFLRNDLLRDSYYTVNSFFDYGKKTTRSIDNLRYLTLAYADLDCYQVGLKPWETIGKVGQMAEDGLLPSISALAKSGRGVWVFWILRDRQHPDLPQRAFKDRREEWQRIQAVIHARLRKLGAEAKDAARYTRVPGSINSKNPDEQVSYLFLSGPKGPAVYTLEQLTAFFGLQATRREKITRIEDAGEKDAKKAAAGKLSVKSQVARKLRDWENLCIMRNGYAESSPSRNKAALIGASLYFRNGYSISKATDKLEKWNQSFRPPLSEAELQGAIFQAIKLNKRSRRPFAFATMRDDLGITEQEAANLEGSNYYYPGEKLTKQERIDARRATLRQILAETKGPLSQRDAQKLLAERGIQVALGTIHTDYKAIKKQLRSAAQKALFSA